MLMQIRFLASQVLKNVKNNLGINKETFIQQTNEKCHPMHITKQHIII